MRHFVGIELVTQPDAGVAAITLGYMVDFASLVRNMWPWSFTIPCKGPVTALGAAVGRDSRRWHSLVASLAHDDMEFYFCGKFGTW